MARLLHVSGLASLVVALALAVSGGAVAHEERESRFPDQGSPVPTYRPFDESVPHLVVCKDDSAERIAGIADPPLRELNEHLLAECAYEHIQDAVNAVQEQGTNIYVLPGRYLEEPTRDAPCEEGYDGGVVSYEEQFECGAILNLVTVVGDDPDDDDIVCDLAVCDLQIEGTGERPEDVLVHGGFREDGEWVKHNGIRADRADGFYLRNVAVELVRENAIYVHETDGYVLDRVLTRYNDLYGILTFTSDHGVIKNCETHHNGDSGVYPGSPADVNAENETTGPLERWAVEVFNCDSHHNALGFSGTAGNSVYFHDNYVHHNGAGYVTDSFVPNHPGMPQDHAWLEDNFIWANNENFYPNVQEGGPCRAETPAEVGYEDGVVCPAFLVPVGTGIMIAGGNHNLIRDNHIWDNWRQGAMLFWVPAALRDEFAPELQFDVSHHNHYLGNTLGRAPNDGPIQPNGIDFWWDDEGEGNCWQGNVSVANDDGSPSSNVPHQSSDPSRLPDCDSGGSVFTPSNAVKSASLVPCARYDREDEPDPAGCDWLDDPAEPSGRQDGEFTAPDVTAAGAVDEGDTDGELVASAAGGDSGGGGTPLAATGAPAIAALLGIGLMGAAARLRRMRAAVLA